MADTEAGKRATDSDTATLILNTQWKLRRSKQQQATKTTWLRDNDDVVEITLDLQRDSVLVQGVRP
uniref:Uncharacterized protein n=1 Tax=Aegilops tauschii subsp. strangulata TaxID=200361 RepID=A0A453G3V1_AEGTS